MNAVKKIMKIKNMNVTINAEIDFDFIIELIFLKKGRKIYDKIIPIKNGNPI